MGIQDPQNIQVSLITLSGTLKSGNAIMPLSFKYPAGYFVETVMPMQVIRPAPPNTVEGFYSPDYYGYVGRQTEIRITVQGGAYPFVPVIVSAPAGATIGTDPTDLDNYLVLRFTPTTNGVEQIIVNIFDQDETLLKVSYSFTTSTDWCKFVSPTGSDSADGSKETPWLTINHAFSATTGGRCLIVEDGVYNGISLNRALSNTTVNSMIAWNQLGATFDWIDNVETSSSIAFSINSPNVLIQGIKFNNPPIACPSPRLFSSAVASHNVYQDNCEFNIDGRSGTINDDNVSCLFLGDGGSVRNRFAQTRCKFTGFAGLANGWSAFDTYRTDGGVFECNRLSDQRSSSTSAGIIWPKGLRSTNFDIRNNVFESQFAGSLIDIYLGNSGNEDNVSGNIDVSYNLIRATGNGGIWIARADQTGERLPVWTRRNTIIDGLIVIFLRDSIVTMTSDSDVIQSTIGTTDPHKVIIRWTNDPDGVYRPLDFMPSLSASIVNSECHQSSSVVDSSGQLIGSYLTAYRGQRGHNIWKP